jgi:nucleoside 2-deoxyribosyltransferase
MPTCFVIQPFDSAGKFDKRYKETFVPAIIEAGLEPYRVDQDARAEVLINSIEEGIRTAAVCLADITTDNPNVWYELGFAFAVSRPVVMVCSNERTGKYPFDIQHRPIISYKTEAQSDFKALSDSITERLKAASERGRDLQQIAEENPVAPVSGLSPIEITVLAVAASTADVPNSGFSLWSVRNDAEKAGLTRLAIGLAIRRLTVKQFIEEAWIEENGSEPYKGAAITGRGWDWIDANEEEFVLRRPQRESRKIDYSETKITDDDIPF